MPKSLVDFKVTRKILTKLSQGRRKIPTMLQVLS